MPYTRTHDDEGTIAAGTACVHLRSKAIYVTGQRDPGADDLERFGHTGCWCNQTQHVIGPDQAEVSRAACVPGRTCHQLTY